MSRWLDEQVHWWMDALMDRETDQLPAPLWAFVSHLYNDGAELQVPFSFRVL